MAHDNGGAPGLLIHVLGQEQVPGHLHAILVIELNLLLGDPAALVKIVRVRGLVRRRSHAAGHGKSAQRGCRQNSGVTGDDKFRIHWLFFPVLLFRRSHRTLPILTGRGKNR